MRDSLRPAGVLLLLGTLTVAGHSRPDARQAPPRPRSRVGLLNLTYVMKKYRQFNAYQQELKKAMEAFQAKDSAWKLESERLTKQMTLPGLDAEKREEVEKRLKELQRQVEDNKAEAQRVISRKQEGQLKDLYTVIRAAATRYAMANDLDMVLHYNDAIDEADLMSPANLTRKMQAGALTPLYAAEGVDVSKEVLAELNRTHRRTKGN